ncbi:MAG: SPOR domain-containing protein [Bacteroidaceae bacterium]
MKSHIILLNVLVLFCISEANAQSNIIRTLEKPVNGQGTVTIEQDLRLQKRLMGETFVKRTDSSSTNHSIKSTTLQESKFSSTHPNLSQDIHESSSQSPATVNLRKQSGGYRIQIYSGPATRDAKKEAAAAASKARIYFPEVAAYSIFVSPRWVVVVGDFTNREAANEMRQRIKESGAFQEVSIVHSQILVAQ